MGSEGATREWAYTTIVVKRGRLVQLVCDSIRTEWGIGKRNNWVDEFGDQALACRLSIDTDSMIRVRKVAELLKDSTCL